MLKKSNQLDLVEQDRLFSLLEIESSIRQKGFKVLAGIDEAGRGPLAGPVVAAACVIPEGVIFEGVNDSKKLTPLRREKLYQKITSHPLVDYAIGCITSEQIDKINIYQATIQAMLQAVDKLKVQPEYLLVDGLLLSHPFIPSQKIIKGDAKSHMIGAASIIAKVFRDRLMQEYHEKWPEYHFASHKGYGTKKHLEAIRKYGPSPIHRMTFKGVC